MKVNGEKEGQENAWRRLQQLLENSFEIFFFRQSLKEVAGMVKAGFKVAGMDCASCAATVKKAVQSVEGVKQADVSFAMGKMVVDYDPGKASPDKIREAVKKSGYDTAI